MTVLKQSDTDACGALLRQLALLCGALVFTTLGLAFGESALTGAPGVSRPTENNWFTVRSHPCSVL